MNATGRAWLHAWALAAVLLGNYLANALPFHGRTTGEVSALLPALFTPAGFTFAIWGVIYALLTVWVVLALRQAWRAGQASTSNTTANTDATTSAETANAPQPPLVAHAVGPWFMVSCAANVAWLWTWHAVQPWPALALLVVLWISLATMYRRLTGWQRAHPTHARWWTRTPLAVYFSWVSVATLANTSIVLARYVSPGLELAWTLVAIGLAVTLALTMWWRHRDAAFFVVVAWALAGILVRRRNDAAADDAMLESGLVIALALLVAGIAAIAWLHAARRGHATMR